MPEEGEEDEVDHESIIRDANDIRLGDVLLSRSNGGAWGGGAGGCGVKGAGAGRDDTDSVLTSFFS